MSARRGLGPRGLASLIPSAEDGSGAASVSALTRPLPQPAAPTSLRVTISDPASPVGVPVIPEPTPEPEPVAPPTVNGAWFAELPLDAITPNPRQPREHFEEKAFAELVTSITEYGLLQPIVVRPLGDDRYELIMGERRWRASREAGLDPIPAIVRDTDDDKMLVDALLENLHRAELNAIEEAAAYEQLLKEFGCTQEALADRIGRSRAHVTNTLRLLRLPWEVQTKLITETSLSAGHARALLSLKDPQAQIELAQRVIREELSVRSVEEIVLLRKLEEERNGPPKESAKKANTPRAGKHISPAISVLAERLKDRYDTSVSINIGKDKGKLIVEFASVEDLERIVAMIAPGDERALAELLKRKPGEAPLG
ncbi:ParB/RepB/Spo0J family partition protein [Yinghuangia seranimata]|uniref:ParB/RepB/Spo0J family partition protein n=1 Tax=Yinghuangia seranimata TaxID=408067 RepID=UPI00248C9101|nr:ParB/RepB/Spo0J family partition protein [Yinghuangia seranimata]MDI2130482.1 ParB/RepB/Spo0J family partition protein [Yinghuangia seranimata]